MKHITISSLLTALLMAVQSYGQVDSNSEIKYNATEEELIAIEQEREAMHQDFLRSIKYNNTLEKYKWLLKKDVETYGEWDMDRRMEYSWRLGKVEQLKIDIPMYLNSKLVKENDWYVDWRKLIQFSSQKPSEWYRFSKMADVLFKYFKEEGDLASEQAVLGVRIQAAKIMNDPKYPELLQEMIDQLDVSDPRYKTYHSMMGWHYQDQGEWDKSVALFKERFYHTASPNMLGSLAWGLFNAGRYAELLEYEEQLWGLEQWITNYMLGTAYGELGNEEKKRRYFDKFRNQNFTGKTLAVYFLKERDEKFYYYKQDYLQEIADYFEEIDPNYSCQLNNVIAEAIGRALQPSYNARRMRDVVLSQKNPERRKTEYERFKTNEIIWQKQLSYAVAKSLACE
ncbi:MAG: hypothetical protein ACFHU9_12345 [Fluviicola sp.]